MSYLGLVSSENSSGEQLVGDIESWSPWLNSLDPATCTHGFPE